MAARPASRRPVAGLAAFGLGVCLSLCANIAAAPNLNGFAVAVAASPPLALLLSVELLDTALKRRRSETAETSQRDPQRDNDPTPAGSAAVSPPVPAVLTPTGTGLTAEQRMWAHYMTERARGRVPSGAELDRVAGTNNYGRRVLRRWRDTGHIPPDPPPTGRRVPGSGQPAGMTLTAA